MSFISRNNKNRLVIVSSVRAPFAGLYVEEAPTRSTAIPLVGAEYKTMYQLDEIGSEQDSELFNFPFLFDASGKPWHEANDYLLSLMGDKPPRNRRTDDVRRIASKLLDYLLFCENNNINWLDFSGSRPSLRPTYKYFYHLVNDGTRTNQVINQYTSCVYRFYKYLSQCWHDIDMKRVDMTKQVRFVVQSSRGSKTINAESRSQTRRTSPTSLVPIGFVREDGEDLRPLSNREVGVFMGNISNERVWSTMERLIMLCSLLTGARKQTVLTIRLKHLREFSKEKLLPEGAYKIHAGPGTCIDTKFDKSQDLYIPEQLAEELMSLAESPMMRKRQEKFRKKMAAENFDTLFKEDDVYLFLSDQGNCYYMAKDDPRYSRVKSRQSGQVTETIKRKLVKLVPDTFPKDFSYHWLRATYAFQLYQRLQVAVKNELLQQGELIEFVQRRLHHERRETTENYLKLFQMTQEKVIAQEIWENRLFSNSGYGDLKVEKHDE